MAKRKREDPATWHPMYRALLDADLSRREFSLDQVAEWWGLTFEEAYDRSVAIGQRFRRWSAAKFDPEPAVPVPVRRAHWLKPYVRMPEWEGAG